MDRRWVLTPANTADTSFMLPWGIATDIADLRLSTTIELAVRAATGAGDGRTALLGWSSGGAIVYAYAEYEAGMPAGARNVSALIPTETFARYTPTDTAGISGACQGYQYANGALQSGTSSFNMQAYFGHEGSAALADPNGPSSLYSGITNLQAALYDGAFGGGPNPWYHFVGGYFDAQGYPTSLRYTLLPNYLHLLTQSAGFESQRDTVDLLRMWCGTAGSPYGTHLGSITMPVLYLAVAGGFGTTGDYSTTLLGSRDVSRVLVRLQPVGQELIDYGHVDLWQGTESTTLAWQPLTHWLLTHTPATG
jgi:pimeloyl-ACP methyl ester carboxylesterase